MVRLFIILFFAIVAYTLIKEPAFTNDYPVNVYPKEKIILPAMSLYPGGEDCFRDCNRNSDDEEISGCYDTCRHLYQQPEDEGEVLPPQEDDDSDE